MNKEVFMARGKRNLPIEEQLQKITEEIEITENTLKELKKEKKALEEQFHQSKLLELEELISGQGLSLEEVKTILENGKQNK